MLNEQVLTNSKATFENLVKHLVEIEEDREKFVEEYVFRSFQDRENLKNFFDNYASKVESLVKTIQKSSSAVVSPFVIIGSLVQVQDIGSGTTLNLRVINPLRNEVGFDDVSCLSPVGKALLLKEVGDQITINTPGGIITYKVESITLQ